MIGIDEVAAQVNGLPTAATVREGPRMSLTSEQVMTQDLRPDRAPTVDGGPPRDLLMARRGMVASAHPFASEAGLDVMRRGGNAVDAAIAAAAVLMSVESRNGHLGGDTFMLISRPDGEGGHEVHALNGSGAAPLTATVERYRALGGFPERGLLTSTVPGTVDCWAVANRRFGSRPLGELLEAGIWYAEQGVPVTARINKLLTLDGPTYRQDPDAARVFLPDGQVPAAGTIHRQPDLARSLRRIAAGGADEFYRGSLAAEMVAASERKGGLFTREDFASHRTEEAPPLEIDYRGFSVYEQPPVSQGIIVLLSLNTLKQFDLAALGHGSATLLHLQIEALKLAFEDRLRWLGDPAVVEIPLGLLLSEEHGAAQAARIDPRRARPFELPPQRQPDTTYLCAADEQGTLVSYIHSLYTGAGVVLGETGVLMNSRLLGFTLEEGHPNCLAPGKRPVHTLNPWLVHKDGQPVLVGGTPGANWQVQTNVQLLTNLLDFGMDVRLASEAPRFTFGDQSAIGDPTVTIESRVEPAVIDELRAMGHPIVVGGAWDAGSTVQLIARDPASGLLRGATEVRRPSAAVVGF
jgi:gamma-glutamyltranspeptidase / glutathione hydrolase